MARRCALLAAGRHVSEVVHFGHQQVFSTATTYTCLLFCSRAANPTVRVARVDDLAAWQATGQATTGEIESNTLSGAEWNFAIGQGSALFEKLAQMPVKLGDVAERIFQGIIPGADKVYTVKLLSSEEGSTMLFPEL